MLNTVILIGRLTRDPELKYIPASGKAVASFSLAVDRTFVGKDGQKQTDFFNIAVWGKQAENVANYLSKGSQVAVKGRIENRSWEAEDGTKRYVTEIIAEHVQFLEAKKKTEATNDKGYQMLENEDVPF